jgi:hypothetical protein
MTKAPNGSAPEGDVDIDIGTPVTTITRREVHPARFGSSLLPNDASVLPVGCSSQPVRTSFPVSGISVSSALLLGATMSQKPSLPQVSQSVS